MAIGYIEHSSKSLGRYIGFRFILPDSYGAPDSNPHFARSAKTLVLLHGHGNSNDEMISGSNIKELAYFYNLNVLLPTGENSFYLNRPAARAMYADYVGEELLEYARKVFGFSDRREDTYIGGISMGGFGAIHTGLAYSHNYSRIMALSSALIVNEVSAFQPGMDNGIGDYDYYTSIFGNLSKLKGSQSDPEQLVLDIKKDGKFMPEVFMACGTEDFLLDKNREFKAFLEKEEVSVRYEEGSGTHNFKYWMPKMQKGIAWLTREDGEDEPMRSFFFE